ncbi:MAG: DUF4465 domain-containing protein [Muribaculum sp.]|nr:DUF4465 domain-containing protein [Muribaculaceae bacterium]MCM1081585.1 DUF4465 domain-containing protein [Muribaculum sp.]
MRSNLFLISALLLCSSLARANDQIITLDLTKSTTKLEFNADNGSWVGTYDDDKESIESQCFSFVHSSMGDYNTWWGFTASNSADNSRPANTLTHQWSNMAAGGIELDSEGNVKVDEFGAPVVNAAVPYLVAYYGAFMGKRPTDMVFNDGKLYEPQGVYVNLNSYPYYSLLHGDGFARAFTNGDKFTLTIYGVAADGSEKNVAVTMASYTNGDLSINRGWKYVDLTSLGAVNELYFTMESTDKGLMGMNTPGYFCMDKLMVKPTATSGIDSVNADDSVKIKYNRTTKKVIIEGAGFAMIHNVAGQTLMSGECSEFDLSALPAGVYIVKAGGKSLKIAK